MPITDFWRYVYIKLYWNILAMAHYGGISYNTVHH